MKVTQSWPTLHEHMDYTIHGIFHTRILEGIVYPFSRGSFWPRNWMGVSCTSGRLFTNWTIREDKLVLLVSFPTTYYYLYKNTYLVLSKYWERLKMGGAGDDRGLDGWMASPTQWKRVWVNSGSWWWTGRPSMLQSMGSLGWTRLSDWTELNWVFKHDLHISINVMTAFEYPATLLSFLWYLVYCSYFTVLKAEIKDNLKIFHSRAGFEFTCIGKISYPETLGKVNS